MMIIWFFRGAGERVERNEAQDTLHPLQVPLSSLRASFISYLEETSLNIILYKSHNLLVVMDKEKHSVVTFTFWERKLSHISNFQPYKRHFRFFHLEKVFQTIRNSGKWLTIVDPTKLLFGNSKIGSAVSREKLMKTCLLKNSPAQNEVTLVNN